MGTRQRCFCPPHRVGPPAGGSPHCRPFPFSGGGSTHPSAFKYSVAQRRWTAGKRSIGASRRRLTPLMRSHASLQEHISLYLLARSVTPPRTPREDTEVTS